jgi:hypothetical protein
MANVKNSIFKDPCDGYTMRNQPAFMPGPTLADIKKEAPLEFNYHTLNFKDIKTSGTKDGVSIKLEMDFKATGELFEEVE